MTARPLFVGGTSSNAGKSWMVTAICAWLRSRGISVAPFKAQNMSNHSYPCRGGGEIGRAQVVQAEACGLEPEAAMNPILLKPSGSGTSQVIVNGRMWKTLTAREYYAHAAELRAHVLHAYEDLARRFDVVVIEGAGSVSELNLRDQDLVNLGLATRIGAPWVLVADIERGGVFASVIGTVQLLTAEERGLLLGFMVNKFRGDRSLFEDGVRILEAYTASRCFGVFPHAADITIDAEDSLALATAPRDQAPPGARLAIVRLPHLSNGTDFRLLTWADWLTSPPASDYDIVIVPGTKNTLEDLAWLRRAGLDAWIAAQHARGAMILGICGGYQMLGHSIADPTGVESSAGQAQGLGLLPVRTVLTREKYTRVVTATTARGTTFGAYEIHLGVTTVDAELARAGPCDPHPFASLDDGREDGLCVGRVVGTYLHGALEDARLCTELFGVSPDVVAPKAAQYEQLGRWFAAHGRHLDELGLG